MSNTRNSIDEQAREVKKLNEEAWRLNDAGDPHALVVFEELGQASVTLTNLIERGCDRWP